MASIIWCDRIRHIVHESRTEVQNRIENANQQFSFFTVEKTGEQIALNLNLISSYEALQGDGV